MNLHFPSKEASMILKCVERAEVQIRSDLVVSDVIVETFGLKSGRVFIYSEIIGGFYE